MRRTLTVLTISGILGIALTIPAQAAPPSNDNFAASVLLSGTRIVRTGDTTVSASTEAGEPAIAGTTSGGSVWYRWTPSVSGPVTMTTQGSDFDTVMEVFTGTILTSLASVGSNDDDDGGILTSRVHFDAVGGTTYRIAVAGYGGNTGAVRLTLFQGPASTTRVSLTDGDTEINGDSWLQSWDDNSFQRTNNTLSADGTKLAFQSAVNAIVAADTGGLDDVYVRDTVAGTTTRVSVDSTNTQANSDSYDAAISDDGNVVAFTSEASDIAAADGNGAADVFARNVSGGTTTRISIDTASGSPNDWSENPSISDDGNVVVYESWATDLVAPAPNGNLHIFARSIGGATTTQASVSDLEIQANNDSWSASTNSDGTKIAFESDATNLVLPTTDNNGSSDIFLRDTVAQTTTRVSVDSNEAQVNSDSYHASVSESGQFVAFVSDASNVIASDTNNAADIFVRDLTAGTTQRVSISSQGIQGKADSDTPIISGDGRYVVFGSDAPNLVQGDTNQRHDVFLHDRLTGLTTRFDVETGGDQGDGRATFPSISEDGDMMFLYSGPDLAPGDSDAGDDAYLRSIGFQADSMVKAVADPSFLGDGIYSANGTGQVKKVKGAKGSKQSFSVRIENDGSMADRFTIQGCSKVGQFGPSYKVGAEKVTALVTAGTYTTTLEPGQGLVITTAIKIGKTATGKIVCPVTATSASDATKVDQVKIQVTALR